MSKQQMTQAERRVYDAVKTYCKKKPQIWFHARDIFPPPGAESSADRKTFGRLKKAGHFDNDVLESDENFAVRARSSHAADIPGQLTLADMIGGANA